ncbi:MAG: hypothetical protein JO253_02980 [Alphaproteobacteria bacterium]|nr:hypothetical protein [Alphaproteobacteria bacterium]
MVANVAGFNPMLTTNAAGSFNIQTDGYVQGVAMDEPSIRNTLAGGILASTETLPMWGGVAISESLLADASGGNVMGNSITRAASVGNITGFSVFNQAFNAINNPQSKVPTLGSGMTTHFHRLGSGARIAVACDPSLVSLNGGLVTQQVSWDFNNQLLQPYVASTPTVTISSMTPTFNASTGVWTIAVVTAAAADVGAVGDAINISGATNSGTAGNSVVNGNFIVSAFTDNQHFSFQVSGLNSGSIGTIAGSPVLNQGVGALNVRILNVNQGNSLTVSYNPNTNFANWNPNGSCALILI